MMPFLLLLASLCAALEAPQNLRVTFGEKSLDIHWDTVPGASGYHVYSRSSAGAGATRRRVNARLITSGPHFTYIWDFDNGKRVRRIKGYTHFLSVTAVDTAGGTETESAYSSEADNRYFEGFRNIDGPDKVKKILVKRQAAPFLPVKKKKNSKKKFLRFMDGPGRLLHELVKKEIDPLEVGGCAPVTTILVRLLREHGLFAYRVEGNFIREFHTFAVINIKNVEYVLDFTADQFIPGVSPVMIPRDYCNLNSSGRLSQMGKPVYQVGKIFAPHQTDLADGPKADIYRSIYARVKKKYK